MPISMQCPTCGTHHEMTTPCPEPEPKVGATCVVLENAGLILAVSRKDNPRDFGLPGGKMEPGETPEACARRELEEETGILAGKLLSVFLAPARTPGRLCECFLAFYPAGKVTLREAGAIGWVAWDVLFEGSFGDYNRRLKAALDARPPCSDLQPGEAVTFRSYEGAVRTARVLQVTADQVFVEITSECPGRVWFDADEVHRLERVR